MRLRSAMAASAGVEAQHNEQQNGEAPQRGAAIAEKRQRYAYDRAQAYHHTDVDAEMKDEIGGNAVGIHA